MKTVLVTGSGGLVGSETALHFCAQGFRVIGGDNNLREYFFGPEALTKWAGEELTQAFPDLFFAVSAEIRDFGSLRKVFEAAGEIDLVVHTAAQPSHDWAAREPFTDFSVNALGTLNVLEATRWECAEGPYADKGIDETMSIDQTTHSHFGASKVAADVMVQEYGKYFGMKTGVFRGGCLTGPRHSEAELHVFLAYLMKCAAMGREYKIFGYKGKQVRDNIHSADLVSAF